MGKPSGDAKEKADVVPLRPARPCPICGKPSTREHYPFDSKRCADVDLNRWLSGAYAIPGEETEPGDTPPAEESPDRG
jgi:endogenous inhibitor of DNA gyrase (YacG/DUF329 family)